VNSVFSKPKNELPLVVVFRQEKISFKTKRFSLPSRLGQFRFKEIYFGGELQTLSIQ
jgi:hypothetical protein